MNLAIYLLLLGLTALAFPADGRLLLVMSLAVAKFLIVGFGFMDLRHAHPAWKVGFTTFALLFLAASVLAS